MAKKSVYSQVPKAGKKAIAGTNPVGVVGIGAAKPPSVPQKQSSIHGLDVPAHTFRTPSVKGAVKYGNVAKLGRGGGKSPGTSAAPKIGKKVKVP